MHDVFWCVLCVWAKLPEIKLDDDDDYFSTNAASDGKEREREREMTTDVEQAGY